MTVLSSYEDAKKTEKNRGNVQMLSNLILLAFINLLNLLSA